MCKHIKQIKTNTKFIILMHPKEYRKTKNGTGHFTNKSLHNSEIHIGIDFSKNKKINEIINNPKNESFLLYPGENSIKLDSQNIETKKQIVLFILDSTWPCSKKMLRMSKNLQKLKKVSFESKKVSDFKIKTQPDSYCLSTIETTQYVLELLNKQKIETILIDEIKNFTKPFNEMVNYQINCARKEDIPRYK